SVQMAEAMEVSESVKDAISIDNEGEVEVIFLRLTLISTDSGLQAFTDKYLVPLLTRATPDLPFLAKINELLTHYNKRVRGNTAIRLPVDGLIELIEDGTQMHFRLSIIYLRWATEREEESTERVRTLAAMMRAVGKRQSNAERLELFSLMVPALNELSSMEKAGWPTELIPLLESDASIRASLVRWMEALLLFQAQTKERLGQVCTLLMQGQEFQGEAAVTAGLTQQEYCSIAAQIAVKQGAHFNQIKRSLVKLLDRNLLPEKAAFPILVVAAASQLTEVSEPAENALKKVDMEGCLQSREVMDSLFGLYAGHELKNVLPAPSSKLDTRSPQSHLTKARIMQCIKRSDLAPTMFMANLAIARNAISYSASPKLHVPGVQFMLKIVANLPPAGVKALVPALFKEMRARLDQCSPEGTALVYAVLGKLGRMHAPLVTNDLGFVKETFSAVVKNTASRWTELGDEAVSQAAVDCLVEWLPVFRDSTGAGVEESRRLLHELVAHFIKHESPRVRMVALKYGEALLSPQSTTLHWLLVRACGDRREEMRKEARRMLEVSLSPSLAPSPSAAMRDLYRSWMVWEKSGRGAKEEQKDDEMDGSPAPPTRAAPAAADEEARAEERRMVVEMLARFLWSTCVVASRGEKDVHVPSEQLLAGDDGEAEWRRSYPKIAHSILAPLAVSQPEIAAHFIDVLLKAVAASAGGDNFLLRITRVSLAAIPFSSISLHRNAAGGATERMFRGSHRTEVAAEAAEVAAALIDSGKERMERAEETIKEMGVKSAVPGLSWFAVALLTSGVEMEGEEKRRLELAAAVVTLLHERALEGYERPSSMLEAALGALSKLLHRLSGRGLQLSEQRVEKTMEVCTKIATTRKDGFSSGARDAAAAVIGALAGVGEEKMEVEGEEGRKGEYGKIVDALFSIGEGPPRPELQFAVGEALFAAATHGDLCAARRDEYTTSEEQWRDSHSSSADWSKVYERLERVVNEIIENKARSENPHLRRATTVWLLVIVQKYIDATSIPPHDEMIRRLQSAFVDGLSESDDFSQDIASKGIGVLYNLANESLKKVLVNELMCTFSEGKTAAARSGVAVISDTPVVQGGIKTSGGEQLTTYKELSSLANELHDPDLLYKFMQLAKHNAAWNAKKGAAFGFSVVFEQARQELEPYVAQLVPKLFRYRYDPDSKVQASMKAIWSVLTSSRKGVVDEFADAISAEITPTLTHPEWRVRESSCLAYADLLSGHSTKSMIDRLPETLNTIFRVQDDVKESVRKAADRTAMAIRKACLNEAGSTNPLRSSALLGPLLPALVDGAAHAPIPKNKQFCLLLLVDLSAQCGKQMKPFIAQVVPCLLDAISDVEPWQLNYVAVRSDERDLEDLDDARARLAGSSSLMHSAQQLLPHVGKEELEGLQTRLTEQLRNSVGVSTRTAAAQLVTHFCIQAPQLMIDCPAVCVKLFSALRSSSLRDRNPSVRKQFSSALSYLARFSGSAQMGTLLNEARELLIGSEEDKKVAVRNLLKSLSANAPDALTGHSAAIVPYVLMETCQEPIKGDEESRKRHAAWTELWSELVPSTETAVRLYGEEIVTAALEILKENQVWAVRAQAAAMLKEVVAVPGQMSAERTVSLLMSLLGFLNGRYWTGKERILQAIEKLMESSRGELSGMKEKEIKETFDVLLREAKRRSKPQSLAALKTLAQFASTLHHLEAAETTLGLLKKRVEKEGKRGSSGVEEAGSSSSEEEIGQKDMSKAELSAVRNGRLAEAVGVIGVVMGAYREADDLSSCINFITETMLSPMVFYRVKQSIVGSMEDLLEKPSWSGSADFSRSSLAFVDFAAEMASTQRRTAAVNALVIVRRLAELRTSGQVKLHQSELIGVLESFEGGLPKEIGVLQKLQ
ncbi:hypothetical protein PFISCL1PPCAC_11937, partial [Pristionchus fissidentatus]